MKEDKNTFSYYFSQFYPLSKSVVLQKFLLLLYKQENMNV